MLCLNALTFSLTTGLGTTASAPVYDRSVNPPIFAGVVGLDFSFSAMEKALGEENEAGKETVISKMVERSIVQCPNLNITQCQREALSREGERCSDACVSTSTHEITECPGVSYSFDVFNNRFNKGRSYPERACCNVGESREIGLSYDEIQDNVCVERGGLSGAPLVGFIVGCSIGGCCGLGLFAFFCYKRNQGNNNTVPTVEQHERHSSTVIADVEAKTIYPIPPPSAPPSHYNSS